MYASSPQPDAWHWLTSVSPLRCAAIATTNLQVVLMARLFTGGKDYGPHAFVVQIRDMETPLPLPGITVGDIGPKMG